MCVPYNVWCVCVEISKCSYVQTVTVIFLVGQENTLKEGAIFKKNLIVCQEELIARRMCSIVTSCWGN